MNVPYDSICCFGKVWVDQPSHTPTDAFEASRHTPLLRPLATLPPRPPPDSVVRRSAQATDAFALNYDTPMVRPKIAAAVRTIAYQTSLQVG
jgi:hypothetical protein